MEIKKFEGKYLDEAMKLSYENYLEECEYTKSLPNDKSIPNLSYLVSKGIGVVALDNEKLIGFWLCFKPWNNAFGSNVKGTFSPVHAHGAITLNRDKTYKRMYEALAKELVSMEVMYHGISFYAHDNVAKNAMFQYGFGMRLCDAMKLLSDNEIIYVDGINYEELPSEYASEIRELRKGLFFHLHKSPCFLSTSIEEFNYWISKAEKRDSRYFVAKDKDKIVAFFEVCEDGETFVSCGRNNLNFCGAYCMEGYRGKVAKGLLSYIENTLYHEGIIRLGVDFESYNPTAYGFWSKYFEIYTNSLTRRIDECGIDKA